MWGCLHPPEASAESNGSASVVNWGEGANPGSPRQGWEHVPYAMAATSPCWALELSQDQHGIKCTPQRSGVSLGRLPKHPHNSTTRRGRC